jgi:phage-related protein
MPRTLSEDVLAEKDKDYNRPVELYQIYLDEQTLYLAMYPQDIEFFDENGDPQTYTAAALSRTTIETNTDTKVDQCEVTIDNVTREMSAYIAATEFVGRRIKIMKVFLDADRNVQSISILGRTAWTQLVDSKEGSGLDFPENAVPIFDGIMDAPRINQYQMTVTVVSKLDTLDRKLPARTFQVQCPWQFGSEECGFAVPEKSGTIDSLSGDYITIYDADINEAADYWEYGEITIGTESRIITESGSGYVVVEYPFPANVEAGDSYEMKAGCDKSFDSGHGCSFWGNTDYYGGFLSIPKIKNIKEVS